MATRRDQLQSYQFLLQRIVSALVYRKTDPAESPFRRAGGAIFAGVMLSILALAVTAVIGLFATGCGRTANWKDGAAIIKEEETGAFYVILPRKDEKKADQKQVLYETANFASAALIAGTTEVFEIKAQSLRSDDDSVSMGPRVGIPGAPNSIPKADALSGDDWTLCSFPADKNNDTPTSKLYIGTAKTKGDALGKDALLAKAGEEQYLVSQGHKYPISDDAIGYLNATGETVHEADKAVLDGVESGEPLEAPDYGDPKDESTTGDPVGTVYKNTGGGNTTFWVATKDNIASITELQAYLITEGSEDKFKEANTSEFSDDPDDLKPAEESSPLEKLPEFADAADESRLCAVFPSEGKETKIVYNADTPDIDGVGTPEVKEGGAALADQIVVAPGTGALVETGDSEDEGGLSLVTASGEIFGIEQTDHSGSKNGAAAPADALTAFGYRGDNSKGIKAPARVHMPSQVLSLIPRGPDLSPDSAMETVGSR
ncbi:type VII secretion protein EccB [Stackebrandtia nassauensis]|uniref:Type VII secretion protein EccB n=1 Tax=Stackebrandtia nassauensis (strain DSM 44728 / CIP 108903 / NRRL B-16338 / NBRC 102104 / LLR-40K-21) TaxID=446470 RepID=D3Q704_STANL|nr:type VII secretion protein EccB [Stackebrandtia nassauensis]ADD40403.1 protein of unknown function DUF690 [Stackebrandtia nassauensis DSM 44728]